MIRTRFAPSPTGSLHIGGLRTAAYAYALAKHNKGKFLLRIEDTDQARSSKESEEEIYKYLTLFGLEWDEKHVQSERVKQGIYQAAAQKLVDEGNAYYDDGAIRIRIPRGQAISYHDYVLDKKVTWKTDVLKDLVILKSDGFPTYHLAVVVDDHDMGITHVLRGHDWIPSTPIHLLIYKFMGFEVPSIGHLTDILDPAGGKLSKRKGSVSIKELIADGYLPEALLNFVILLGWAPKDNRELFTLEEFVDAFDPAGFQKSNPVLNRDKLNWFNGHYIRRKTDEELVQLIKPYLPQTDIHVTSLIKERISKLSDVPEIAGFFYSRPDYSNLSFCEALSSAYLPAASEVLSSVSWTKEDIESRLLEEIKSRGWKVGDFFMSLRLAITGKKITPPLTESILILGKDESLFRINQAIIYLGHREVR